MNAIKKFWSNYSPHNLHPEDLEYLGEKFSKYCLDYGVDQMKDRYGDNLYSSQANEKFDKDTKKHNKIFSKLYPVPFFGDIMNAKVYILSGNPGFKPFNFIEDYQNDVLIKLLKRNLNLEFLDSPFNIEKTLDSTGGYGYWKPIYDKFVKEVSKKSSSNLEKIEEYVHRNVAVIESVAYHSKSSPLPVLFKLPSSQLNKRFVHDYVLERVSANQAMIFVWRGSSHWELDANQENIIVKPYPRFKINNEEISDISDFLASKHQPL